MFKRDITFKDFDGNVITEPYYFNINESELVELESEFVGGLAGFIDRITKAQSNEQLIQLFKRLVLMSYGVKSEDGRHFLKDDADAKMFMRSNAYDALFMELVKDEEKAIQFIINILPEEYGRQLTNNLDDIRAKAMAEESEKNESFS